jgi:citrate lyase subunit beta/citryl-CoA lyase
MQNMLSGAGAYLFVPGDRPDRFDKAIATGADHVILDLEDAVAAAAKDSAREQVAVWLSAGNRAIVRINGIGTSWHEKDLAILGPLAEAIVLPKSEDAAEIASLAADLDCDLLALIETPAGVAASRHLARSGVTALLFGNVDFAACIGVDPSSHAALHSARSALVYASAEANIAPPVDGVTTSLRSSSSLSRDLAHARELGFGGKLCVHPDQVGPTQDAFQATPTEIAWATSVLTAGDSVGSVNGEMVDAPVLRRAQMILERTPRQADHGGGGNETR